MLPWSWCLLTEGDSGEDRKPAKTYKEPKCPLAEQIKLHWPIHGTLRMQQYT